MPVVREHAGIAGDHVMLKSMALGCPDENFPANAVVSTHNSGSGATMLVMFGN